MLPRVRQCEFSFILGTLGVSLGLLTKEGMTQLVGGCHFNYCAQSNFFFRGQTGGGIAVQTFPFRQERRRLV